MNNYNWNYPTTMWVGENRIEDLNNACKNLNIKKPLLVTDKGLYVGSTDKLTSRLAQHKQTQPGNIGAKGAKILYTKLLAEEDNRIERLKIEKKWIKTLQPALNQLHTDKYQTYFQLQSKKNK